MLGWYMSEVYSLSRAGAWVPEELIYEAIADEVMRGWDWYSIEETARRGLADIDKRAVRDWVRELKDLGIPNVPSAGKVERYILDICLDRVEAAREEE